MMEYVGMANWLILPSMVVFESESWKGAGWCVHRGMNAGGYPNYEVSEAKKGVLSICMENRVIPVAVE
jgi:hypothetical protein